MKNNYLLLLAIATLFSSCSKEPSGQSKPDDGYELVWGDEFNYTGAPDPDKWNFELGFIRNKEPQLYVKENAVVQDGNLIIEARKERVPNPGYDPNAPSWDWRRLRQFAEYTSSSLNTRGKFEFKYGRVVMRGKIDIRQGNWPAFWMLGTNIDSGFPQCGEVDIMEYLRRQILANAYWEGRGGNQYDVVKVKIAQLGGNSWADSFHTWRMDWDSNNISIFLDDKLLNHIDVSKTRNAVRGDNPFRNTFFLMMNLALGHEGEYIPDANMPSRYYVDYVRIYQKK